MCLSWVLQDSLFSGSCENCLHHCHCKKRYENTSNSDSTSTLLAMLLIIGWDELCVMHVTQKYCKALYT